jgi:hypothetical protein
MPRAISTRPFSNCPLCRFEENDFIEQAAGNVKQSQYKTQQNRFEVVNSIMVLANTMLSMAYESEVCMAPIQSWLKTKDYEEIGADDWPSIGARWFKDLLKDLLESRAKGVEHDIVRSLAIRSCMHMLCLTMKMFVGLWDFQCLPGHASRAMGGCKKGRLSCQVHRAGPLPCCIYTIDCRPQGRSQVCDNVRTAHFCLLINYLNAPQEEGGGLTSWNSSRHSGARPDEGYDGRLL